MKTKRHYLSKSKVIGRIPLACSDELAAVKFLETQRWGNDPACVLCGSTNVYKMKDASTGKRNKRFLWRCHDCKNQYTVRKGTVYEESRLDLRHWCYAFWRASTSKKGVAALEVQRHCQISLKSALFLLNRIRFAMAPDPDIAPKLTGTVECDETYVGGKPRYKGDNKRGRGTKKIPVFAAVERQGRIRRRVITNVTCKTLEKAIHETVDSKARIITDDYAAYIGIGSEYAGGHESIRHSTREYVRGDIHTNTAESSFAIVKRGLMGIYQSVSKEYLHRYLWQFDFIWNNRHMNDGERTVAAIQSAEGKRLMFQQSRET